MDLLLRAIDMTIGGTGLLYDQPTQPDQDFYDRFHQMQDPLPALQSSEVEEMLQDGMDLIQSE